MELKDITCDLKYARKLKCLGVEQTSSFAVFYGGDMSVPTPFQFANQDMCGCLTDRGGKDTQRCFVSTFTSDELLKMLPLECKDDNSSLAYYLCFTCYFKNIFGVWYETIDSEDGEMRLISKSDKKFSNALAKVLIWLLQKKKIKPPNKAVEKKEKELKIKSLLGRTVYKRAPRRFYSNVYDCWVLKTKTVLNENWYECDLIKEKTGEKIETISDRTMAKLGQRVIAYISNPNLI